MDFDDRTGLKARSFNHQKDQGLMVSVISLSART